MNNNSEKVHLVIHSAATTCGMVGAGLAQAPGSDNLVITPIQISMIIAIGEIHGRKVDKEAALCLLTSQIAGRVGRTVSQILVGWIPGLGNAINAATAFGITEALGWSVNTILSEDTDGNS